MFAIVSCVSNKYYDYRWLSEWNAHKQQDVIYLTFYHSLELKRRSPTNHCFYEIPHLRMKNSLTHVF